MKMIMISVGMICSGMLFAQGGTAKVERGGVAPLSGTINLSDTTLQDWEPHVLNISEQNDGSKEFGEEKTIVNSQRKRHRARKKLKNSPRGSTAPAPVMLRNFTANNAQGTPNDNHIAISNDGKIVSVVNTNFRVYNQNGTQLQSKTLSLFGNSLGILMAISDPRVIYDPVEDRFIVVFFSGNTSSSTHIIVAFSKTNDPAGQWNLYSLNGNSLNDSTWSDYPIVSLSDKDLFMTFNHLIDGNDWKVGFRYSAIWQIDKQKGYDGDSLQFDYWHHIDYNGQPVWNVCPIRGGTGLSGPETYFLSVRPSDLSNDTVFLQSISDSYLSGNAQFSMKALKTDVEYGIAPDGLQKDGQYLATNDARVLDGFIANDRIQYVHNTLAPQSFTSGVYLGTIDHPGSANPSVFGQIISNDTIDFGYPSIAYMGNNAFDNRAIITCSFSSPDTFPGTVAFYKDAAENISDMLVVKNGEKAVDVMLDSVERWGDYTGIQRKYNEPNVAWLAGSYVYPSRAYRTWIAELINPDSSVVSSLAEPEKDWSTQVFPNPAADYFSVKFRSRENNFTRFAIYDVSGKLIRVLLEDKVKDGENIFSFSTRYLSDGIYFLKITDRGEAEQTAKVVIRQ